MEKFKYICFWVASIIWGFPLTFIGAIVALIMVITGHKVHRAGPWIYFRVKSSGWWGGAELGPFFLVSETAGNHTIRHEAGHGIQNVMLGPFMIFIVCLPSLIRCFWRDRYLKKHPTAKLPSYDSIWFEGMASCLGDYFLREDYVAKEGNN